MKKIFEGAGVAIVTPFKENKIDYNALEKLIDIDIDKGVSAIILLGTTGEGATISLKERFEIIKFAKNIIRGRVKLIVGTGHNDFKTCVKNTIIAKKLGADGVLVVTPYYNKTSQQGIVEYYTRLAKIGIPIIMYNVPSRTGLNIELNTLKILIEVDNICGIKESTCDINRIIELTRICKNKIAVYSGEDHLNYVFYTLGATGCVSVTANVLADKVQEVYRLSKNQEFSAALKLQESLAEINKLMFIDINPIPIKTLMAKQGLIDKELRMPLVSLSVENDEKLLKLINIDKII